MRHVGGGREGGTGGRGVPMRQGGGGGLRGGWGEISCIEGRRKKEEGGRRNKGCAVARRRLDGPVLDRSWIEGSGRRLSLEQRISS